MKSAIPRLRNLIPFRSPYAGKEATFLCSYPKSGRTWLRFILGNYLNSRYELGLNVDLHSIFRVIPNHDPAGGRGVSGYGFFDRPDVPLFICNHSCYAKGEFAPYRIIFLLRSVCDVLVSDYFHVSRQRQSYDGDLPSFIRDPDRGVDRFIDYLNGWAPHLMERALVLTYEGLSEDTSAEVARALQFAGIEVLPGLLEEAVACARFNQMQAVEVKGGIAGHDYDPADREALRVRRGVVGGYVDYFSKEDEEYVQERCRSCLSPPSRALLLRHGLLPYPS